MATSSVTTLKETTTSDSQALLRKSRQCAALTSLMRSQLGGAAINSEESEMFGLTSDLASAIYVELVHSSSESHMDAFEVAGKLRATLESVVELDQRVSVTSDDEQRCDLVTRIGWLQNSADDLAKELAKLLEVSSTDRYVDFPAT